jgi:uncharacterized membrane protein
VPGYSNTVAFGINASGQIVGAADNHGPANGFPSPAYGFLLDQGSYTTLDVPGAYSTSAYGINDSGQIVGYYDDAGGIHGFLSTPVP